MATMRPLRTQPPRRGHTHNVHQLDRLEQYWFGAKFSNLLNQTLHLLKEEEERIEKSSLIISFSKSIATLDSNISVFKFDFNVDGLGHAQP